MNHLCAAKDLKESFPEETRGFDVFQVERIWEEYSDGFAAGWLNPTKEIVRRVFDEFRL